MLNLIISFVIVWAIIFGVNLSGKHYGLHLSTNGVSIEWGK